MALVSWITGFFQRTWFSLFYTAFIFSQAARSIGGFAPARGLDVSDSDSSSYNVSSTVEVTINNDSREVKRLTKRSPLIIGKAEVGDMTEEKMSAVIGFVKPEKSAKLIKNQVDYETALQQYNKAIQKAEKPAGLIIDALKLDYQNSDVNEFAAHLWKLYYSLGSNGRQVKERMLGWGYSLEFKVNWFEPHIEDRKSVV